jgi:23S rRNA (pseudouridine1915-N3)-methyltransferase
MPVHADAAQEHSARYPDQDMRLTLFVVGRLKAGPEKELVSRYLDRFAKAGPAIGLELAKVVEVPESRAANAETRKREEASALERALPDGAVLILLDERGRTLDSQAFSDMLGRHRDGGKRDVMLAIGGADGLDPDLRAKADFVLNLGTMTWPHQIVRILIAEQLYRAVTILSGHPYHRV